MGLKNIYNTYSFLNCITVDQSSILQHALGRRIQLNKDQYIKKWMKNVM